MKIMAGITLYNPDIIRLQENIEAVISQVDEVVLFDNGSSNYFDCYEHFSRKVSFIHDDHNKGIAYALNQLLQYAINNGYDWILTLDQDSVVTGNLISVYKKFLQTNECGLVTCSIKDRNFYNKNDSIVEGNSYEEIDFCITSGALCSTVMVKKIGGYIDDMFIDSVDYEFCYHIKKNGYKMYRLGFGGLLHEVGRAESNTLFGRNIVALNEPAWRHYYMVRNHWFVVKQYQLYFSIIHEVFSEVKKLLIILIMEHDRIPKLKNRIRGMKDIKKINGTRRMF